MTVKIDDDVRRMFELLDPIIDAGSKHDKSKFSEYNKLYSINHDKKYEQRNGTVSEQIRLMDNVRQTVAMGFMLCADAGRMQVLDEHISKAKEEYEYIRKTYFSDLK